jgi:hypothetical protein
MTPPSGDKHDYMSQAPYFWADPSKPGGLPYIRRDGERNPEIEKINNHSVKDQMEGAVETLAWLTTSKAMKSMRPKPLNFSASSF